MTSIVLPLLDDPRAPTAKDDRPCGCLLVIREDRRLSLPLRSVSFNCKVRERIAEVTLEQTFENPHRELLEAVYVFPLPGSAAVSSFELHVGGKKLKGLVEERGEARRQYDVAIAEGRKAAILEQERDDVFTVKVGNLPPGEAATVKMTYGERLPAFDDGETELRIPLVVAPRYIPGLPLERPSTGEGTESDTTSVPDASRISPPRLAPGLRGDVKLAIEVELQGEGEVQDLGCTQHATKLGAGTGTLKVALARKDELLDRDFVLRWRTCGEEPKPILLVTKKGNSCFGLLSLVPPRNVARGAGSRDVVFLLDRSGSMEGAKLASAKKALDALLQTLQPQDRFGICTFESGRQWYGKDGTLERADGSAVTRARAWLSGVSSGGGTELDPALQDVLAAFDSYRKDRESEGRIPILVLVTDGQVGNEADILRRIEGRVASLRVFTLGIDSAVNAAFLRRLAQIGRGTATLCEPGAGLEDALARIGREIGAPVLVDVEVDDRGLGLDAQALTPERLPDLYAGRTASVFFPCKNATGAVRVRARKASGGTFEQLVPAEVVDLAALAQLWARSRVADLEDRYRLAYGGQAGGLEAARAEILELALEHQILTRFTAFLVVDHDEAERRLALPRRTVVQAVEQPAQWAERKEQDQQKALTRGAFNGAALSFAAPAQAMARAITGAAAAIFGSVSKDAKADASVEKLAKAGESRRQGPGSGGPIVDGLFKRAKSADKSFSLDASPPAKCKKPAAPGEVPPAVSSSEVEFDTSGDEGAASCMDLDAGVLADEPADAKKAPPPPPACPKPQAAPHGVDLGRDPYGFAEREDDYCAGAPVGSGGGAGSLYKNPLVPRPPASQPVTKTPAPEPSNLKLGGKLGSEEAKKLEAASGRVRSPDPSELAKAFEELSKTLAKIVESLEAGRFPDDSGRELDEKRARALALLRASGLEQKTAKSVELLEKSLVDLVAVLAKKQGKADGFAGIFRAASEALAAQCRAELAPFLGKASSFWEATI